MGRPMSGTKLTVGQIPSEKSALVIPRQEPTMIARKATMLIPTMPATMTARILSSREGSDGVAVDTSSAYPRGSGQYPGKPDSPGERREDDMPTGKVKFYDRDKGFGFIQSDDGQEVFLPASVLPDDAVVKSGARVEFGVVEGKEEPRRSAFVCSRLPIFNVEIGSPLTIWRSLLKTSSKSWTVSEEACGKVTIRREIFPKKLLRCCDG